MERLLLTGVGGYLGRGIVNSLIKSNNFDIVCADICDFDIRGIEYKRVNIFNIEHPYEFFGHPDVVLHLAWRDGFRHYSEAHIKDLPYHYEFIEKMVSGGVKRVSVMGSMHEIGFWEGPINENTPCNPSTPYGISKNALRQLTKMVCEKNGCSWQWLRGFYIVGTMTRGESVFSKLVQASQKGEKMFPFTLGQNQFDFLDYDIFSDNVAKVIAQNGVNGIINICSGFPERLCDRVERFIRENNYNIKLQYGAFPDRPYDSKAIWGDNTKLQLIVQKASQSSN